MKKEDIILNLVRDGKITNEEAKVLLETVKEYVYINQPYYFNTSPYIPPYVITNGISPSFSNTN